MIVYNERLNLIGILISKLDTILVQIQDPEQGYLMVVKTNEWNEVGEL